MIPETPEIRRAVCYSCSGRDGRVLVETEQWVKHFSRVGEPYWHCNACNYLLYAEGHRVAFQGLPEYVKRRMATPHPEAA